MKNKRRGLGTIIVHDASSMSREEGEAFVEYLQAHELLPRSPVLLGDTEIERLAFMLSSPLADRDAKKRALILLAHCRSPRATAELGRCAATLDASLHRFAALALDESVQSTSGLGTIPMPL